MKNKKAFEIDNEDTINFLLDVDNLHSKYFDKSDSFLIAADINNKWAFNTNCMPLELIEVILGIFKGTNIDIQAIIMNYLLQKEDVLAASEKYLNKSLLDMGMIYAKEHIDEFENYKNNND